MVEQAVLQNLTDAGCSSDVVHRFCELEARQCPEAIIRQEQVLLLNRQRKELLDDLRRCQKRIDCLDYLLRRMRESNP